MATELNDMKISIPLQQGPTKEIRNGGVMVDGGIATFPIGDSPTTKAFVGAQGTKTLEEWMEGKRAPAKPTADDLPWMGRK